MTRDEAIKILSTRDNQGMPITWQNGFVEAYDMAIEALERKCGKWLLDGRCSECLVAPLTSHKNYCPNCGADMRGDNV